MTLNDTTIAINGVLGNKLSNIEKVCGATDYLDIQKASATALDKGAGKILYTFDSSGGMVRGCSELASYIKGLPVPTAAFTDSKCNSAAYWLASAAIRLPLASLAMSAPLELSCPGWINPSCGKSRD
jgi:ClpP class serine protease